MDVDTERRQPLAGIGLVLTGAGLAYLLFIWRTSFRIAGITYFTLVDDAMISMRYAQHLARGFGLVWNVGQQPVEGFTNPGWTLVMTLFHLFPLPSAKISLGIMLLSAVILLVNVLVVFRICQVLRPGSRVAPIVAALITAFFFPLVFWALRGMEVGLLVLVIDTALLIAIQGDQTLGLRDAILLGILLAFAVLVRLDATAQVAVLLAYVVLTRGIRKETLIPVLFVAVTIIAILLWQRMYFGDWLPNTYYQKMAGSSAWERVRSGILVFYEHAMWDTALPGAVSLIGFFAYRELRRPEMLLLAALFAAQCAYSVWVGGDYAEVEVNAANRFITQGMPALIILFSMALDRIFSDPRFRLAEKPAAAAFSAIAVTAIALGIMTGRPWAAWAKDNAPLLKADIRRVRLGLFIARNTAPEAVIAVHAAGQIPYYSERTTIDLLGLNDRVVAKGPVTGPFYPGHDKWNYEYSIGQLRPDLVADNWIKLAAYMKGQAEYRHLDNGIYVRVDSKLINIEGISQDYR